MFNDLRRRGAQGLPRTRPFTGGKPPCTEPVYAQYMVVLCPEYLYFTESEHTVFFQNTLNNVFTISQPSKL
jgi:hypothetical protein